MTDTHHPLAALAMAALLCGLLFNCGGQGGGGSDSQKRDALRGEYHKDPDAYRKKWGGQ